MSLKQEIRAKVDEIQKNQSYNDYTDKRFCCGGDYCNGDHMEYIKTFIDQVVDEVLAKAEEAMPVLEVIVDKDNNFSFKYTIDGDYVQTIFIDPTISEVKAAKICTQIVCAINEVFIANIKALKN